MQKNVWIALPYGGTSRGRETVIRVQPVMTSARSASPVDKQDSEKPEGEGETLSGVSAAEAAPEPVEWNDVMTRDTTVEGQVSEIRKQCRFFGGFYRRFEDVYCQ